MRSDAATSNPKRVRLFATGLVAVSLSSSAAAPDETPRIPGAVAACPAWLKKGAPFDVDKFFAMPAGGENAAPLYLDAFAEFSPEVAACLPATQAGRAEVAKDRVKRLYAAQEGLGDKSALDRKAADALLNELHDGFRKLAAAQRRPRCVFAIGVSADSPMPHVQGAREVVRAMCLRVFRDVEKGELERPIQDVAAMLRLSRDLRPRAPLTAQLFSSTTDGVVCMYALPIIVGSPALKVEHCDRLLAVLREYETAAPDRFTTGVQGDYVLQRALLHAFQDKRGVASGKDGRPVEVALTNADLSKLLIQLSEEAGAGMEEDQAKGGDAVRAAEAEIRRHAASWAKERRAVDDLCRAMTAPGASVYSERVRKFEDFKETYMEGKGPEAFWLSRIIRPVYPLIALSTARGDSFVRASEALVAARRWQSTHAGADPTDLAAACKAAGLAGVPIDPFSNAPLKSAVVDGRLVVYSIGPDGVDDRGLKDSDLGRKPDGDMLFRLPAATR